MDLLTPPLPEGSRWLAVTVIHGRGEWSTMLGFTLITAGVCERHAGTVGSYESVSRSLLATFAGIDGAVIHDGTVYIPIDMKRAA